MNGKIHSIVSVLEAYGMYLLTGAACVCIGSSMPSLMDHFNISLAKTAMLASAFAVGRVATVFLCGLITEKLGTRFALCSGIALISLFLGILPITTNYYIALILVAMAGFGMGMQDSACPVILSIEFPNSYGSAMSASQAFFGAGCFLPPLIMSILLTNGLSWKYMYFSFLALSLVLLAAIPFMKTIGNKTNKPADKELSSLFVNLNRKAVIFTLFFLITFTYCAVTNTFHTYTSSYVMSFGITESVSVNVLTLFSVGAMVGSIVFMAVLKKLHTTSVLLLNSSVALAAVVAAVLLKSITGFLLLFSIAGFFYGVIFSVLVTLSTELMPSHAALAASLVAFVGGSADVVSPIITGAFVGSFGIGSAFVYAIAMAVITAVSSLLLRMVYKKEITIKSAEIL